MKSLYFFAIALIALTSSKSVIAESETLTFTVEEISLWESQSFVDQTHYQLLEEKTLDSTNATQTLSFEDSNNVLSAHTEGQASALYREVEIDLQKTPYLQWRWRVDQKMTITDPHQKSQDDYPARIYVVFKEGIFPWQVRTLNYVWASHSPTEDYWPNPYTDRAAMIPLRSNSDNLKQWYSEKVNILKDYQRVFNRTVMQADGIAIMSDADNTGGIAQAYYGDLFFSAQ